MASLHEIKENWEGFAQVDPMWAICTDPRKFGNRWTRQEFFETGKREIRHVMDYLRRQHQIPVLTAPALDFGCGVGRLTRALSEYFDECWGVDISPTMIELAKEFNKETPRCHFWLNHTVRLARFPAGYFGFIYSSITLQHIPRRYIRTYLLELIRVLRPGGVFVFQVPDTEKSRFLFLRKLKRRFDFRKKLARLMLGRRPDTLQMEVNCFPESEIREIITPQCAYIADIKLTNSTEPGFNGNLEFLDREPVRGRVSKQYCVVKTGSHPTCAREGTGVAEQHTGSIEIPGSAGL